MIGNDRVLLKVYFGKSFCVFNGIGKHNTNRCTVLRAIPFHIAAGEGALPNSVCVGVCVCIHFLLIRQGGVQNVCYSM